MVRGIESFRNTKRMKFNTVEEAIEYLHQEVELQEELEKGIYRLLIERDCENEFQRFDWERRMPAKILDYVIVAIARAT